MRDASPDLREVLAGGGFGRAWVADLIYDEERIAADVPLLNPSFLWDASNQIQGSGSTEIVSDDLFGRGIVPREIGDRFSPFGVELQVDMIVRLGSFAERIPMGRFVNESVPDSAEYKIAAVAGGLPIAVESRLVMNLRDYMLRVQRDKFPFPRPPGSTSMWTEAITLTDLAVVRNVSDVVLPTSVTYDEDRLKALDDIFAVAGAWPQLTPAGQLTARPKAWPATVDTFTAVASAPQVMESERVYNRVVVEGKSPAGAVLRSIREITEGFLRVRNPDLSRSPFGVATYDYQSDFLTTQAQCDAMAETLLAQVSQLRSVTRTVVEPLMPLREVGDVVTLDGEPTRITSVRHDDSTTVSVVEVNP